MSAKTEVRVLRWAYQLRPFRPARNLSSKIGQVFDASWVDCPYLLLLASPVQLHRIGPEVAHIAHFLNGSPI
jgi:hypothetical protein